MKGKLSIGKVTCCGSPEEDYINIELEDGLSSIQFVKVKVSLMDFTKALFGLGHVPVEFELSGLDRVGKRYEHKTEQVYVPDAPIGQFTISDDLIDKAVSKWETDGWVGSRRDCKNHHNWVTDHDKGSIYNVHFARWVDVIKEED